MLINLKPRLFSLALQDFEYIVTHRWHIIGLNMCVNILCTHSLQGTTDYHVSSYVKNPRWNVFLVLFFIQSVRKVQYCPYSVRNVGFLQTIPEILFKSYFQFTFTPHELHCCHLEWWQELQYVARSVLPSSLCTTISRPTEAYLKPRMRTGKPSISLWFLHIFYLSKGMVKLSARIASKNA